LKKLLVFSSGTATGGGSGFRYLAENCHTGVLKAEIVAVVTNHPKGGVCRHAQEIGIPVYHPQGKWDAEQYQMLCSRLQPDLVALSGWLKFVVGIKKVPVVNIHPGRLPETAGLHGLAVHHRSLELHQKDPAFTTAVTMHFVPYQEEADRSTYDTGQIFFEYPVAVRSSDTAESLAARVNEYEHGWQAYITNLVLSGKINWNPVSQLLIVPRDYQFLPQRE